MMNNTKIIKKAARPAANEFLWRRPFLLRQQASIHGGAPCGPR